MPSVSTNRAMACSYGPPPSAPDPPTGSPVTVGVWLTYQGGAVSTIKHKRTRSGALGGPCGDMDRGVPAVRHGERAPMTHGGIVRVAREKARRCHHRCGPAGSRECSLQHGCLLQEDPILRKQPLRLPQPLPWGAPGRLRRVTSLKPLFLVSDRPVKGRRKPSPYPCRKRVSGRGDQAATWRS